MMKQIKVLALAALLSTASYGADAMLGHEAGDSAAASSKIGIVLSGDPKKDLIAIDKALQLKRIEFADLNTRTAPLPPEKRRPKIDGEEDGLPINSRIGELEREIPKLVKAREAVKKSLEVAEAGERDWFAAEEVIRAVKKHAEARKASDAISAANSEAVERYKEILKDQGHKIP